ncbi:MAG: hypothetical protein ACXW2E_05960 [Nitrososphaeraceae archaeon]
MKTSQRKKLMSEFEKRFIQKNHITKEEKFLSKSMQGHSPKYE